MEEEDPTEAFVGDYVTWPGVDLGRGREGGGEGGYHGFEGLFCRWVEDEVVEGGGGGGYGVQGGGSDVRLGGGGGRLVMREEGVKGELTPAAFFEDKSWDQRPNDHEIYLLASGQG